MIKINEDMSDNQELYLKLLKINGERKKDKVVLYVCNRSGIEKPFGNVFRIVQSKLWYRNTIQRLPLRTGLNIVRKNKLGILKVIN